jgi:hypothetical protein
MIRQAGHQIIMEDGLVKFNSTKQNLKTVMTQYEDGMLLRMKGKVIPRKQDFARVVDSTISPIMLWHVRYGYFNFESLSQLQKQGMVRGLPTFKKENTRCEVAFMENKIERHFQQIHGVQTDVCNLFIVTFVDP